MQGCSTLRHDFTKKRKFTLTVGRLILEQQTKDNQGLFGDYNQLNPISNEPNTVSLDFFLLSIGKFDLSPLNPKPNENSRQNYLASFSDLLAFCSPSAAIT